MNLFIQVEGALGILKNVYGFDKFLLRERTKVKLVWQLSVSVKNS